MGRRDIPKCCRTCSEFNGCILDEPAKPCTVKANGDDCAARRMQHFCPAMRCRRRKVRTVQKDQKVMW